LQPWFLSRGAVLSGRRARAGSATREVADF
jgi:hypothetical protein